MGLRHSDLDAEAGEFGGELSEPLLAISVPELDDKIPTLCKLKLLQLGEEIRYADCQHFPWSPTQPPDSCDLPRLLRLGGERRGECTGQRGQQKAAAVHYSIT
jgi:hypothetical protein